MLTDCKHDKNVFKCNQCSKVAYKPVFCSSCEGYSCQQCPCKCKDSTRSELTQTFLKGKYESLRFQCPHAGCKVVKEKHPTWMSYDQYFEHLKVCSLSDFRCPYKACAKVFKGHEIEAHVKGCLCKTEVCPSCNLDVFSAQMHQHNCLEDLRLATSKSQAELAAVERDLGIDFLVIAPRCQMGHVLKIQRGRVHNYENKKSVCKQCKQKLIQKQEFFYHCTECRLDKNGRPRGQRTDYCRACVLTRASVLSYSDRFRIHNDGNCKMERIPSNETKPWVCHCWNLVKDGKGCLSGMKWSKEIKKWYRKPSATTSGWYCKACNVHVCLKCCLKHRLTDNEKEALENKADGEESQQS